MDIIQCKKTSLTAATPSIGWLNTPAINSTTSHNVMHMPQGRGCVTRLATLAPKRTEGAFNGLHPSAGSSLLFMWENDFDWLVEVLVFWACCYN